MYRLLEVGEVIEKGDEYYGIEDKWLGFPPSCVGMKTVPHDAPIRRLVKPAVTPAASSVPDPGEGYRLIDKAVDKPEPGDEYWNDRLKSWETRCFGVHDTSRFTSRDIYRRKLPAVPAPVLSVGDRVKVLSGPWAGCTGVVAYFQVEATMSGFFLLTARENSKPAVLLDNVFVGGNRLMVAVAGNEVEPLPPVVPEVLCRDLSHGEIVKAGDEIQMTKQGKWEPVRSSAGTKVGDNKHDGRMYFLRRPVRLQSPGWRYLDAGETVQAGDEVWSGLFNRYVPASADRGSVVNDDKLFRRKLPANQGG